MTIKISKHFEDKKRNVQAFDLKDEKLKELFQEKVINQGKLKENYKWLENGVLEIEGTAPMAVHSFILEAEKLGLNVKYTKNTIIELY